MRSAWALSAGLVAIGSTGCGITADYSGLQGGARASLDGGEEMPVDAAIGASSGQDSGLGGADAGTDAPDGGAHFCATLATAVKLCTDFDEGEPVDAGWGGTDLHGGESITVDTNAFSPPGSFLSVVNASDAPSSARLLQTVPTESTSVHVGFEMLLSPSNGTFELAVVHEVTSDGTTYGLYFREVGSALQVELRSLEEDGGVYDQSWPIGAPPATWTHIVLDMSVSDSGSFTVEEDGVVVVSETNQPTSTPTRTAMFVELGFYTYTPAAGQADFDNAIVDWP